MYLNFAHLKSFLTLTHLNFYKIFTGGFRGGGGDVRPTKKTKKSQINIKKMNGEERKQREREERFSLFASNYHDNLQVYLNFPASYVP